jgi:hypothetical protein
LARIVARAGTEKKSVTFYRNQEIEDLAEKRLAELEQILGRSLAPPIPIEIIAEKILGLDFLWEEIEELPGEIIYGAIRPKERLIVLNEKSLSLFQKKPGLERATKGHEMGHFDLYMDIETLDHPYLLALHQISFVRRRAVTGEVIALQRLLTMSGGQALIREIKSRADDPDEARAVNRYASAISMPKEMLREEALQVDRTQWRNLYYLAEKFEVTISALTVRLSQLNLLHVKKNGDRTELYESVEDAMGQRTFGW